MVRLGNLLRDVNYQDQTPVFRQGEARNQSPPLAEMLTPSELDRLRRSTQEAETYLKTAFKNHNVNLKTD